MLTISDDTQRINDRFFEVIDLLKRERVLSGIYGFSMKYDIVLANLYVIKNQKRGCIKAEWLMFLVRDFNISAHWLLTGEGDMFR